MALKMVGYDLDNVISCKFLCEKASISKTQLNYWIRYGLISDQSCGMGSGKRRIYTLWNLIEAVVFRQLAVLAIHPVKMKYLSKNIKESILNHKTGIANLLKYRGGGVKAPLITVSIKEANPVLLTIDLNPILYWIVGVIDGSNEDIDWKTYIK